VKISSRHRVLRTKAVVLSAGGKGRKNGQAGAMKLNESEEPKKRR